VTTIFLRGTGEALDPYLKSKLLLQRSAHGLPRTERYMRRTRSLIGLNDLIGLFSGMEEAKCVAKPLQYRSRPCERRGAMISAWFNLTQKSISQSQNTELSRPCGAVRSRSHDFLNGGCTIRLSQGFSNIVKMYKRNLHPRLILCHFCRVLQQVRPVRSAHALGT
jgi:hypothetical protein